MPLNNRGKKRNTRDESSGEDSDVSSYEDETDENELQKIINKIFPTSYKSNSSKYNIILSLDDRYESDYSETESESESESDYSETESESDTLMKITNSDLETYKGLIEMTKEGNKGGFIEEMHKTIEKKKTEIEKKNKRHEEKLKKKNVSTFKSMLNVKNNNNDIIYFSKLKKEEQLIIIEDLKLINSNIKGDKPYRIRLIESKIPMKIKSCAFKKISALNNLDPGGGEYNKLKNWVDSFMQIPFGKFSIFPIKLSDGKEKTTNFMMESMNILDNAVYGLNDAKLQIMQIIGQWIVNPEAVGSAIAIKGPPGTGKTTLVKEGISKIMNRNFEFIALGGATDSSYLEGHSYTYEGSIYGKIVDILIKSKTMNPVIFFDELDKISDTPKGEEITGILTHLTDTTQNTNFHDKYFSEIDFDISKCLFIFSYNDESKINPILKDRLNIINTSGYKLDDKCEISKNHLIPASLKQVGFNDDDLIFDNDIIKYIISTYTSSEKGVRNLKRCFETISTKINLYRLIKPDAVLFDKSPIISIEFPLKLTKKIVDELIKKDETNPSLSLFYT